MLHKFTLLTLLINVYMPSTFHKCAQIMLHWLILIRYWEAPRASTKKGNEMSHRSWFWFLLHYYQLESSMRGYFYRMNATDVSGFHFIFPFFHWLGLTPSFPNLIGAWSYFYQSGGSIFKWKETFFQLLLFLFIVYGSSMTDRTAYR